MKINLLKKILFFFLLSSVIFSFSLVSANETPEIEPRTTTEITNEINAIENEATEATEETSDDSSTYTDSDLFLYGTDVELSQTVNGNVAIYGQNVTITGEIYGDLIVIANSLNVTEDSIILGNILAYANDLTVSGIVSDVYALSSNFKLESSGIIGRNLNVYSNNITINGKISRDANVYTSNLSFGENDETTIGNNLNYWSTSEQDILDEKVSGSITFNPVKSASTEDIIWSAIYDLITGLVFSLIIILLSIWIAPDFKNKLAPIIKDHSFKAFGIGLVVIICTIAGAVLLLSFTFGFGGTAAVAALGLLILTLCISNTIFSMSIAKLITDRFVFENNTPYVLFSLLVVLILALIEYIPYIGGPINIITTIIGLGILCINFYKRRDLTLPKNDKE